MSATDAAIKSLDGTEFKGRNLKVNEARPVSEAALAATGAAEEIDGAEIAAVEDGRTNRW